MIADQNFYDTFFTIFHPTASATAYGRRPKFFRAEHSATAEGENCAYGPTLIISVHTIIIDFITKLPTIQKNWSLLSVLTLDWCE